MSLTDLIHQVKPSIIILVFCLFSLKKNKMHFVNKSKINDDIKKKRYNKVKNKNIEKVLDLFDFHHC